MKIEFRALALLAILATALTTFGFTQSGIGVGIGFGIPMGHEWVTRLAAIEVIDRLPFEKDDPRNQWGPKGKAKNTNLSSAGAQAELRRITANDQRTAENRYGSKYNVVFDAIIGERWVDSAGFNVAKSKFIDKYNCWDAVAQEPPEIQYDHFMRRYDDRDAEGGVQAMLRSQERFKKYFVDAALAPSSRLIVWDGGGYSAQYEVDRNYFLFGRAVHIFEDSFSPEHTVRIEADNFETVRQVKAYLCSSGAEQHSHAVPTVNDFTNRDVIWKEGTNTEIGWASYRAVNMRTAPLVGTEGTKDLWAAFIRTMGTPMAGRRGAAEKEADALIANWLSGDVAKMRTWYDDESNRDGTYVLATGQSGKGVKVSECMNKIDKKWEGDQMKAVRALAEEQRNCLFNVVPVVGYDDLFDPSVHMPFNWDWQWATWRAPGSGWRIPERPADTGTRWLFSNRGNGQPVVAAGGLVDGSRLETQSGRDPLSVTQVGSNDRAYYRATFAPWLFLSYNFAYPGEVKLYAGKRVGEVWLERPTVGADFRLVPAGDAHAIFSLTHSQYIWRYQNELQLNRWGDKSKAEGQWRFERQP
jgi:hypothetical protein